MEIACHQRIDVPGRVGLDCCRIVVDFESEIGLKERIVEQGSWLAFGNGTIYRTADGRNYQMRLSWSIDVPRILWPSHHHPLRCHPRHPQSPAHVVGLDSSGAHSISLRVVATGVASVVVALAVVRAPRLGLLRPRIHLHRFLLRLPPRARSGLRPLLL